MRLLAKRVVIFTLGAAVSAGHAVAQGSAAVVTSPRVQVANGTLVGTMESGNVRLFLGIPFAAPPVRELRWQPPPSMRKWSGLRAADRFAAQCMQTRAFADMVFRNEAMSEGCTSTTARAWLVVASSS